MTIATPRAVPLWVTKLLIYRGRSSSYLYKRMYEPRSPSLKI
ncbi:hypothetical protein FDUTEX481_01531 [Tolypothrix sp. PCC 7601]|nr:hypothetical protein FDUTEX481_01531 [Tolypothrix sp. PCC 7601]